MPFNANLFKTSSFRLVAAYLVIFALSVGAVLAYVYWNTVVIIERQTDETIRAEVQGLAEQYGVQGLRGLNAVIERRSSSGGSTFYILVNPDLERISGNLKGLPPNSATSMTDPNGWIDFPIAVDGPNPTRHVARGYYAKLSGGYQVLVGRDVDVLRQFRDLIQRVFLIALGLALALGLAGGMLTSRNFLRRIDGITGTSRSIMAGDLSQRMPIRGSGDEIDRLSLSLNEMLDQIERLMAGMKDVTSNVAHDLKTPLTRMRARVENALRSGNKESYKQALVQTIDETDQLLKTFTALMSIARAEAGQAREGLIEIDAASVVADVAELYEPMVEEANGQLHLSIEPALPARADRQLLAQAITNLLDNALKYGAAENGFRIEVSARTAGDQIEIAVADNGSGIPSGDRDRVKDRFVRLDQSRSKPGNGLGLALVSSVMKLHGGELVLGDNNPGLIAKLMLPVLRA